MNRSGPAMSSPGTALPRALVLVEEIGIDPDALDLGDPAHSCLRRAPRGLSPAASVPDLPRPGATRRYSSRSTLRRSGKITIHSSATATVPTPPTTAAGTAPISAATTPLSNSPSWFEALMNR